MSDQRIIDKLVTARIGLLLKHPFFGNLATRLKLVNADDWCPTAATDGRHFFYNTKFIDSLTPKESEFLFGHEVLHNVFEHMLLRIGDRDPMLWNVAADYAVNQILKDGQIGEMPKDAKGKDTQSSSDGAFDSVQADGLAALVVCAIIAAGAILALVTWVQELNADLQATVMLTQRSPLEKPCSTEVEAINSSRRANKGIERSRDESLDKKNKKTEYAFIRGGTPRTTSPTFSVESEESDGFGDSRHNHFAVGPSDLTFTTTLV